MGFPHEVKDRLVAQGVGVFGTNIFINPGAAIPDGNGPYLSITETHGTGAVRTQNDTGNERPTAQILVRATSPTAARTMIFNAYNALGGAYGLFNITLGTWYISLTARQNPGAVGMDETGKRLMFSFNIDAEKHPS